MFFHSHNIQKLHGFLNDIKGQQLLLKTELLNFMGTWTRPSKSTKFTVLEEMDERTKILHHLQNKRIVTVYIKADSFHSRRRLFLSELSDGKRTLQCVGSRYKCLVYIIYCNSNYHENEFRENLVGTIRYIVLLIDSQIG